VLLANKPCWIEGIATLMMVPSINSIANAIATTRNATCRSAGLIAAACVTALTGTAGFSSNIVCTILYSSASLYRIPVLFSNTDRAM
jgi:hypothetical protein